jgi:hypothetical protein
MNASELHNVLTALERHHDKRWKEARKAFRESESVTDAAEAYAKELSFDAETQLKDAFDAYIKALMSAALRRHQEASRDPETEIPDQRFVPLPPDDRLPDYSDEEEAMAGLDDQDRLKALAAVWDPNRGVTPQGREILTRRILRNDTLEDIAKTVRPPVSGPSQVRKIVQREVQKIQRFSKVFKDLE